MKNFAKLLHQLILTPSKNEKVKILTDFFVLTPDPERGYVLGILMNQLDFPLLKSSQLKALVSNQIDPVLFTYSYHYVGDLAETIALIWPKAAGDQLPPLSQVILCLQQLNREEAQQQIALWLNQAQEPERWALLKLMTGNLRIGLSTRTAILALANLNPVITVEEIEEVCYVLTPPYQDLFDWLVKGKNKPYIDHNLNFRPLMLSYPITADELNKLTPNQFLVEWKWDGIRVLLVGNGQEARLYSRNGEDISHTFPEIVKNIKVNGAVDGELLINTTDGIGSFNDLQKRLNRKAPSAAVQKECPPIIHLYDLLFFKGQDLRPLPLKDRREKLENWVKNYPSPYLDLSPTIDFKSVEDLKNLYKTQRSQAKFIHAEGFMVKNQTSPYISGRVKGHWYKWKRDPFNIDAVLMYAQRGHGKRGSYYSDYTFGVWTMDENHTKILVPVGKAYSGYSNEELLKLDKWVRKKSVRKFGPVCEVSPELVFEIEFEGLQESTRHKAGLAMRFPRIKRIRWDKLAVEADTLDTLQQMLASYDHHQLSEKPK